MKKPDWKRKQVTPPKVGEWFQGRFKIHFAAFVWESENIFYLAYLGSPNNRFVSEEVVVEITKEEFTKSTCGQIGWDYFKDKYVTC